MRLSDVAALGRRVDRIEAFADAQRSATAGGRKMRRVLEDAADPDWPAWPPEFDAAPRAWMEAHWAPEILEAFDDELRAVVYGEGDPRPDEDEDAGGSE